MHKSIFTYDLSEKRQLFVNLFAALTGFVFNIGISFFLSPYVVRTIGAEANGFIKLSSNFITYAGLTTVALNSMASRFISIAVHKNDTQQANRYYTAVFYGNCFLAAILAVAAVFVIAWLDRLINIPAGLLLDVKLLFTFLFSNFLLSTIFTVQGISPFVRNRLYLDNIAKMVSETVRVSFILFLFILLKPKVSYMGVTALIATSALIVLRVNYKRQLLPDIHVKRDFFDWKALRELLSSGIWNTVVSGGWMLLTSVDLLIANLFIGPVGMGALALAKTIPNLLQHLITTLSSVFAPQFTILYAKGDMENLTKEIKRSMKITGVLLTIPFACVITFGNEFFCLWVPSQDSALLNSLSVISCLGCIHLCGVHPVNNIFTITNKLKGQSLLVLASGALSIGIIYTFFQIESIPVNGLYIIVSASIIINFMRDMLFTLPFSAKAIGLKWSTFFPQAFYSIFSSILLIGIGYGMKQLFAADNWIKLMISVITLSIFGLTMNVMILLNKEERGYLKTFFFKRIEKLIK